MGTERYVEFDYDNNGTVYSMEYMMLLQAVCSEIDVVAKTYAAMCEPSFKPDKHTGLNKSWYYITLRHNEIVKESCTFRTVELSPWKDYYVVQNVQEKRNVLSLDKSRNASTPSWWNSYNKAKHDRAEDNGFNYRQANLQNVMNAFAALYILETNMLTDEFDEIHDQPIQPKQESSLFDDGQEFYLNPVYIRHVRRKLEDGTVAAVPVMQY